MDILTSEMAVIVQLKAEVAGPVVEGFPDDPVNYILKSAKGALLVQYLGSLYTEPETFFVSVKQKPGFDVTIITKNLRTHHGAYEYLEAVKKALTGFVIEGEGRMFPIEDGLRFYLKEKMEWHYGISFGFNARHEQTITI
jgi:hypothetical protein